MVSRSNRLAKIIALPPRILTKLNTQYCRAVHCNYCNKYSNSNLQRSEAVLPIVLCAVLYSLERGGTRKKLFEYFGRFFDVYCSAIIITTQNL
jgi:hypothetical protein